MGNDRSVIFYTPPSYLENTLKVHKNVLIMHDGQNVFDPKTAFMGNAWMAGNSLDLSIVTGTTEEVLVAAPYNTPQRMDEYTYIPDPDYGGGKGDLYLDFLESTIIPLTKANFRVDINRDTLGILGSSLGGLISCYAGWTRSDIYGKVGCMSSSFWWDNKDYQTNLITSSTPEKISDTYMDSGDTLGGENWCELYTKNIYDYMLGVGYTADLSVARYVDHGATHSETYWGPRFHYPMEFLYPASGIPMPPMTLENQYSQ